MEKILIPEVYLPIIYIVIGVCVYLLLKIIITKLFNIRSNLSIMNKKRAETLEILFLNIAKYLIVIFVVLAILTVYGVNIGAILAGLGIVGLVVGLAIQDIIKDFLSGIFIILDNQYSIGDTVEIGDFKGKVIFLGLKTTKIKRYDGAIKIIANRNINEVINHTLENSLAIVDISVSYESNNDKVEKVLNELAQNLTNKLEKIKGDVTLAGIVSLADSAVVYRMTVETEPLEQYGIERQIRKEVKMALDKAKIKIPYPQLEVHNGK